jgi:integrase
MKSYSLSHVLNLWRKSKQAKQVGNDFEKHLSIALRLYVIPELDAQAQNLKTRQFAAYCNNFSVDRLKDTLLIFNQQTEIAIGKGLLSEGTRDNYRSTLKRFLEWVEGQVWWRELFPVPVTDEDVAPFRVRLEPKPTRGKLASYGLTWSQLPEHVVQQIEAFKEFRLTGGKNLRRAARGRQERRELERVRKPRVVSVKPTTFKKEEQAVLRFLGWYVQEYPDSELNLELLTDVNLLDDYTYWATQTRGVSYSTGEHMVGTAIAIAKWLNYDKSKRRSWSDVPIVLELQDLQSEYSEIYQQENQILTEKKWKLKKLTHQEARQVVQYIQSLCAPNYGRHNKETGEFLSHGTRPKSAIARAWQTYLIVKLLVYCPVRQEEVRNLKLGDTLFRKEDKQGIPYYVVKLKEHKRSSTTHKPREYKLPAILTEDLDMWVYKWRPLIEESVKTLEGWLEFWGYGSGKVERIRARLEAAKQGVVAEKVEAPIDKYIHQEEARLQGAENRIAAWEVAKANFESHNYLFFITGKRDPKSFGKPHYVASIWRMVNRAIATATLALFSEARWTNPHALRHIAEKHIRQIGKSHIAHAFGTLVGHSKQMGDEYAAQITSEYELTEDIVDDWWE